MSFRNSGYRPLTPSTPAHSPHPSISSVRSRTPGQLSLHEYRKLQASPSPVAVMGQKGLKRRHAVSRLQIHGVGDESYGNIGVLTAPSTPMQDAFSGIQRDTPGGSQPAAQVRERESNIENYTQPEYSVAAFDFEFSPPPSPDSPRTHYSQTSELSPLLPFITTTPPAGGLFSSALAFSRPSSILHRSLNDHSPSIFKPQYPAEPPSESRLIGNSPQLQPAKPRHFKSAKRLPRPDIHNHSSAASSPYPPTSISSPPADPSNNSSPFTLSPYDFPNPPRHTHHSRRSDCFAVSKSPAVSFDSFQSQPGAYSDQTESFSDLLHLYGASFELLNKHESFQSEHILSSPAEEESLSTESMNISPNNLGANEPRNAVVNSEQEFTSGPEPANSTVEQVIDFYTSNRRDATRAPQSTAGHPPTVAPPELPNMSPRPLFSAPVSFDGTPVVEQDTADILDSESSTSGDDSLEWARRALSRQIRVDTHRSMALSTLESSVDNSPVVEQLPEIYNHVPESLQADERNPVERRGRDGGDHGPFHSPGGSGMFSTPSSLRRREAMYFERFPDAPPRFPTMHRDVSYHSPADYPEHLLSDDPNSQIDASRLSNFMTSMGDDQEMSEVAKGKQPMKPDSDVNDSTVVALPENKHKEPAVIRQTDHIELQPLERKKIRPTVQPALDSWDVRLDEAREKMAVKKRSAHELRHAMIPPSSQSLSPSKSGPSRMRSNTSSTGELLLRNQSFSLSMPSLPARVHDPVRSDQSNLRPIAKWTSPSLVSVSLRHGEDLHVFEDQYKLSKRYLLLSNIPGFCFVALFYYRFWGFERAIEDRTDSYMAPRAQEMHFRHRKVAGWCLIAWIVTILLCSLIAYFATRG